MIFEDAVIYFKNFYQFGPMKFNEVCNILYHHGWSVQLIKEKRQAIWQFTRVS